MRSKNCRSFISVLLSMLLCIAFIWGVSILLVKWNEARILREIVRRLSADTRVAEVLVTNASYDEATKQVTTTIKFLEYDAYGKPLPPKYFTFQGDVIQFQSLVIRFQDKFVETGDQLKGKSAYIFLKAFALGDATKSSQKTEDGQTGQTVPARVLPITRAYEVPDGYKIPGVRNPMERRLWEKFWKYALDPVSRSRQGIKSVQIEAPGSVFVPGTIYTLKIEHDGGLRIDSEKIPEILRGEKL
ncbi:MAG: hypothetical protein HY586_00450 [Candidatus Omnitrophica bacterium]|nr:hypothetical protein [Candidatus Omnitrophota bacterium]